MYWTALPIKWENILEKSGEHPPQQSLKDLTQIL